MADGLRDRLVGAWTLVSYPEHGRGHGVHARWWCPGYLGG